MVCQHRLNMSLTKHLFSPNVLLNQMPLICDANASNTMCVFLAAGFNWSGTETHMETGVHTNCTQAGRV